MNDITREFLHSLQTEEFDDIELIEHQIHFILARLIHGLGDSLSYNETLNEILEVLPVGLVQNAKDAFDLC